MKKNHTFSAESFFAIVFQPQTYRNLAYLLLSFPLGILYFVVTVTAVSAGAGTLIIGVGLGILSALILLLRGVASLERQLAETMLGVEIKPARPMASRRDGILGRIADLILDIYAWRTVLFALLKFPIGVASFVMTVVGLSVPLSFAASVFLYRIVPINAGTAFYVDTLNEALLFSALGVLMLPIALHLLSAWANFCALIVKVCLGEEQHATSDRPSAPKRLSVEEEIVILKSAEAAKQPAL